MSMMDKRITELKELAAAEGITLPYPPEVIIGLEDRGKYVDLVTGLIGDANERVSLTVVGEAAVVVDKARGGR